MKVLNNNQSQQAFGRLYVKNTTVRQIKRIAANPETSAYGQELLATVKTAKKAQKSNKTNKFELFMIGKGSESDKINLTFNHYVKEKKGFFSSWVQAPKKAFAFFANQGKIAEETVKELVKRAV